MKFGKERNKQKGIERKGTIEKPKSKKELIDLDKRRARNLFKRMIADGFFPEDIDFEKPKSFKQAISLLKDTMNNAPEEAYKGLKNYVFNPNVKKRFTKQEICQYAKVVKQDLGNKPAQEVSAMLKRKNFKCSTDIEES